ncbi:MAG: hypothetical protein EF812_01170 [Methanosarcinales archaeon]|nr:MAG: hypothetical protein EF812_01170 [Methanosarcinales archaeon]
MDEVMVIKMLVLRQWYGLPDPELERQANAKEGQFGVELHKNVVILKKRGYMSLYDKLKW